MNNPEDPNAGTRKIPFTRELYIDRDDFMETPPPKYFRLRPGGEVRLKYAYIIKCEEVVKDDAGNVTELRCTADLDSKTGGATATRKVKGTIHWVSAAHAVDAEVRLYDRLFTVPEPDSAAGEVAQASCLWGRRASRLPNRPARSRRAVVAARFQIVYQSGFVGSCNRKMRAGTCQSASGRALPIRASRLFRSRSEFDEGQGESGIGTHHVERHLGEAKK